LSNSEHERVDPSDCERALETCASQKEPNRAPKKDRWSDEGDYISNSPQAFSSTRGDCVRAGGRIESSRRSLLPQARPEGRYDCDNGRYLGEALDAYPACSDER